MMSLSEAAHRQRAAGEADEDAAEVRVGWLDGRDFEGR